MQEHPPYSPSRIRRLVERVRRPGFVRDALTVFSGTAVAQLIPLAAAPLLTRLYTPEDFGALALFFSIATLVSVLATFRYNHAVVLPKSDRAALSLTVLALGAAAVVCAVLAVAAALLRSPVATGLGYPSFAPFVPWIALCAFLLSSYATGYLWLNRKQLFRRMAFSRITQMGGTTAAQVGLGLYGAGGAGLVAGVLAGQLVGNLIPAWSARSALRAEGRLAWTEVREQAARYRDFPRYALPADFLNAAANQAPVVLMGALFGATVLGWYHLTLRTIAAPVQLLGSAVLDAFRERAARDFNELGNCRAIYRKTFFGLALLGLPPSLALLAFGPALFEVVFGAEWRTAGEYARLVVPSFYTGFIASPLGYTLYIAERQRANLVWQLALCLLTSGALLLGAYLGGPKGALTLFSGSYSAMYLVYLAMSYHFAGGRPPGRAVRGEVPSAGPDGVPGTNPPRGDGPPRGPRSRPRSGERAGALMQVYHVLRPR